MTGKKKRSVELLPITRERAIGEWVFDLFGATEEAHWHDEVIPASNEQTVLPNGTVVTIGEGHSMAWYPDRKSCPECSPETSEAELKKWWTALDRRPSSGPVA